jgi:hypothetical protein
MAAIKATAGNCYYSKGWSILYILRHLDSQRKRKGRYIICDEPIFLSQFPVSPRNKRTACVES